MSDRDDVIRLLQDMAAVLDGAPVPMDGRMLWPPAECLHGELFEDGPGQLSRVTYVVSPVIRDECSLGPPGWAPPAYRGNLRPVPATIRMVWPR